MGWIAVGRLSNLFLVRGGCIPSVRRATWNFHCFSLHSLISLSLQHWNLKCALVVILRWLRRIVMATFVSSMSLSLMSKNGSALASHLYACFFNFKIETRHCIFNAWLRYWAINYFETGMWNTEREAVLFILLSFQISIYWYTISTINLNKNSDKNNNTSIQNILSTYTLIYQ